MEPKTKQSLESVVREIKRKTRRKFNSEEQIRIVLEGLKGEDSIAVICRREGIAPSLYYKWSKMFLQAGKRRLDGDTMREANSDEVSQLRQENEQLKQLVAELSLKNRVLKKKFEWAGVKLRRYMRYSQSERMQVIRTVEESPVSVKQTLLELNINRSTFYKWYRRYQEGGYEALANRYRPSRQFWNAIPPWEKKRAVEIALEYPEKSPRELAWHI